jgi:hypothetical protein
MKYPDISGQMAHVTIGNAHTPAEEYMKDIFTRVNAKTTNEMRVKVKDNTIRDFRKNVEMSREMLNFKANHLVHKMNSKESVASIKALYEAKEFDAVYASFDELCLYNKIDKDDIIRDSYNFIIDKNNEEILKKKKVVR